MHEHHAGGPATPLERYNLTEYKLAAIVWGGLGYYAMVEAPDGRGYFIRVGALIGTNKGVVKKISENSVVVEETYKTFSGETERKEIVIPLRKEEGGSL